MTASTKDAIPVLNTPNFSFCFGGKDGRSLPLDEQGLMRNLETILLPGSSLTLEEQIFEHIYKITTSKYFGENLYIDIRFLENIPLTEQTEKLPTIDKICEILQSLRETAYLWGGNWPMGIDKMRRFYPPSIDFSRLSKKEQNTWLLKGVDCSGLLYYSTNGYTPRNTCDLVTYKDALPIENLKEKEIVKIVKPLDLITWKGHVIIVLNEKTSIESTPEKGVHTRNLSERMEEILKKRKAVNQYTSSYPSFIICRWHPESL